MNNNIKEQYHLSKEYMRRLGVSEENINKYYTKLAELRHTINPRVAQQSPTKEIYLKTRDGTPIFVQMIIPNNPRAIVLFQHGHAVHSDLGYPLADFLFSKNIGTILIDNRGHGRSGPKRGKLDHPEYMFPLYYYLLKLYPDVPKHFHGESLGTTMIAKFLTSECGKKSDLRSVILQVPPYRIRIFPLFRMLKYPILILTNLLNILSLGRNIMFNKPKIQKSYYKEFIQVDFFDPIRVYFLTAKDLITTTRLINDFPKDVEKVRIPTLILEGTADSLCDPVGAHQMYRKINTPKKKLIIYQGAEHSLFNDVNAKKIYEDIYDWIISFD